MRGLAKITSSIAVFIVWGFDEFLARNNNRRKRLGMQVDSIVVGVNRQD